jgi:ABC-type antimicrobial peptide transport system permease subunit
VVVVTLGSVLGIIPGILGSKIIDLYLGQLYGYNQAITVVSPSLILQNIILVVVVGVLFSIFPAFRATQINIVKAFREG